MVNVGWMWPRVFWAHLSWDPTGKQVITVTVQETLVLSANSTPSCSGFNARVGQQRCSVTVLLTSAIHKASYLYTSTRLGVIIDASPEISRSPCVRPAKGAQLAAANASSIKWCRPVRCWSLLTNPVVTVPRPACGPCHLDPDPFSGSRLRVEKWRNC